MNSPWHGKSGLAKAAAILASILSIALGLCGLNFGAFYLVTRTASHGQHFALGNIFMSAAYLEAFAIVVSAAGLVALLPIVVFQAVVRRFQGPPGKSDSKRD